MSKIKTRKIIDLIKIFLKDSYQNIDIFNMETKKINKKSIFLWMLAILFVALLFISDKIIKLLVSKGQEEIFLNIYFLILAILMMFQTILVCTNVFYFSKDLEFVLPLPIQPIELLIAKYGTLLSKLYVSEIAFGLTPILIYGIRTNSSLLFYIYAIIVFILFPIFLSLVVSVIMMFVMKISKFIRNKDIFQVIMTLLLIILLFSIEYKLMGNILMNNTEMKSVDEEYLLKTVEEFNKNIKESNKYFLVINPSVDILVKPRVASIVQILKIIAIDLIAFAIFIIIGKRTYLKDILKNTTYLNNIKSKSTNLQKSCKSRSKSRAYINKEFKDLFRNPMFFMQCVYPAFTWLVTIVIISIMLIPKIEEILRNEEFRSSLGNISFDLTAVYLILGLMQLLFMTSSASLTAVSRNGKNAVFMKYIPISFYKQIVYKGIPQIFINFVSIIVILGIVHCSIASISWNYIIAIFILAMQLNIINSYIMLIVDLIRPKLEWDTEYDVLKQNNNKIFQYVFTVIIILFFMYLTKVFKNVDLNISLILSFIIFSIIILLINIFLYRNQKKLSQKII